MKKMRGTLSALTVLVLSIAQTAFPQQSTDLRIDPLLMVSLKECRNRIPFVNRQNGNQTGRKHNRDPAEVRELRRDRGSD
jgi:hypothetical protein